MFTNLFQTLSHLPVNEISDQVADDFKNGVIPIVTSEVASGKTLLIPAVCSTMLDHGVIYVLEPTRFLAMNAAENMISLLDGDPDGLIGYLNSNRSGEESHVGPSTRIIFTTVGYALSAGIVNKAQNIILDEAHETSIELSLVKAILYKRMVDLESVRLAILSATLDLDNEVSFWNTLNKNDDCVRHYTTKGSAYPITHLHRPAWSLGESVLHLIEEEGKTGILVFVSGKEEIATAINDIIYTLEKNGIYIGLSYEICGVSGSSSVEERRKASSNPDAPIKILVGTNVLESGISLPWVNAGVSSGETKVLHVKGNIHKLEREHLPAWRIKQQEGRVCRFSPGTFILADDITIDSRPTMAKPDIARLPLTELVMYCAKIPDLNLWDLRFTNKEQPDREKLEKAVSDLRDYGLIDLDKDWQFTMSSDGYLVHDLPLSFQSAAAYCEAVHIGAVDVALPLIALMETGDLRHDYRSPLGWSNFTESDLVHQVSVVANIREERNDLRLQFKELAEQYNLSMKKYREYTNILQILEDKVKQKANFGPYLAPSGQAKKDILTVAKQIIFRATITRYPYNAWRRGVTFGFGADARFSNTSQCNNTYPGDIVFATGNLREIKPKDRLPFTVLENVTIFTQEDMLYLVERFGESVVYSNGVSRTQDESTNTTRSSVSGNNRNKQQEYIKPKKEQPTMGALGAALEAALSNKK